MAANLSADGLIWKACHWCRKAIYRFPGGQIWRDVYRDSSCPCSPITIHAPER